MESLSAQIGNYIDYLRIHLKMRVTVHSAPGAVLGESMGKLAPYNIHSCAYCMQMKSNSDIWKECIERQRKVLEKLRDGEFFGICYLGVSEYVFPITIGSEIIGFVCVSGYRNSDDTSLAKIKKASSKFGLNFDSVRAAYYRELSSDIPSEKEVGTLIAPLICMLKEFCGDEERATDKRLNGNSYVYGHILEYINRNFAVKKISVDDIAKLCHCSPSHISHVFAKYCGKGIAEYTNDLRVSYAKEFLSSTDMRIQEISEAVGFGDSNYFSNVFKKSVGMSPCEYRELHGKEK